MNFCSCCCLAWPQEIMTDPSYKGQFVCFTHVHIGNTGINFGESVHLAPHAVSTDCCLPALRLYASALCKDVSRKLQGLAHSC